MTALIVFIFLRQMAGYFVWGVSDATFRDALVFALNKLDLPFREQVSGVKLTGLDADLYAGAAEWMGTGHIRMKQRQHADRLADIANAMNH